MSYERQNSMSRLEQYRARQAERIEAMSRAIDEGRTTVVSSIAPAEEIPGRQLRVNASSPSKRVLIEPTRAQSGVKRTDFSIWVGSHKSATATSVEAFFSQPLNILVAAPIQHGFSHSELTDGQMFSYDASTGRLVPVDMQGVTVKRKPGVFQKRLRRQRSRNHLTANAVIKVK